MSRIKLTAAQRKAEIDFLEKHLCKGVRGVIRIEAVKDQPQIGGEVVWKGAEKERKRKKGLPGYLVLPSPGGMAVMLELVAPGYSPGVGVERWISTLAENGVWAEWVSTKEQIDWVLNQATYPEAGYRRVPRELRMRRQSDGAWLR